MIYKLDTLQKRLYQLIICRLDGDRIHSEEYQNEIFKLVYSGIGGFIIFGGEKEYIRDFIKRLQSLSSIPLFIASDIERGVGQQIKACTTFPCQMAIRAAINKERTEEVDLLGKVIEAIAHEAIDVGINMPLIPVLDVNQNPDNPIVCTRAFSDDPLDVSWFGVEYIKGLKRAGLLSCAKHFPGHGATSADSHIELPEINKSPGELVDTDILPFRNAIKASVSSIMVGHLRVPALDTIPASISERIIKDFLRKELGFKGLILTDALNMSALSGIDNMPAKCLNAGVDILLHPSDVDAIVRELISAVESGIIDEKDIEAPLKRILNMKEGLQKIRKGDNNYSDNRTISESISGRSVTLFKYREGILPVSSFERIILVVAGEVRLFEHAPWIRYFKKICLLNSGEERHVLFETGHGIHILTRDEVDVASMAGHPVIIAVFSEVSAWRGSSGIKDGEREEISHLISKATKSVVISFGSPYILRHFKDAGILIAAYDSNKQAQEAVIKCLYGELDFKGRMPVKIEFST